MGIGLPQELGQQVIILYAGNRDTALQHQAITTALERPLAGILLVAIEPDEEDRQLLQASQTPFCFVSLNLDDPPLNQSARIIANLPTEQPPI